jgi:hypothetical protein
MEERNDSDIRIEDLANPVLTEMQQAALDYGKTLTVDLSVDAVLNAAREQTGFSDFGAEDFRERLAVQLQSADEDPWTNELGKLTVFNEKVRNAASRLRVMDYLKQHPEVDDVEIEKPLIIVGLPRSGTTHLVNLIAADQRFRSMPYFESRQPVPTAGENPSRDERDPRFQRSAETWAMQDAMMPLLKNMHAMTPEHIHEEIELQDLDFSSYTLEWIANVPRWRDYYLSHNQTPHYEFLKRMLKVLRHQAGPDQWVLKSPQHLEQLVPLNTVFPDATVAITHRDPVAVITSAITMLAYGSRMRNPVMHMRELADYWIDRVERLLRSCVRDLEKLPVEQTIDVLFPEFMADDLAMLRRVYEVAGIEMTPSAQTQLQAYLDANPRGKHGQIRYDLEADFGVKPESLYERFDFYYQRYPLLDPRQARSNR